MRFSSVARWGAPGMKVSCQVTGVRRDAFAQANPLAVEVEKPANERGFYINPALYGQPEEKQIEWGRFQIGRRPTRCFRPGEPVGRGSGKASQRARLLYQSCALWATGRKTDRVGPVSGQDAAAQTEACRAEQSGVSQEVGKPAVRRSSVGSRSRSERLRVRV